MELNEFKDLLNQNTGDTVAANYPVANLIYNDDKSPLSELNKKLKYTLFIFPVVALIFIAQFVTKGPAQHSPTKYLLFVILFVDFCLALLNYFVIQKMRRPKGNVRANLMRQITLLKNRYRWYFIINNGLFVLMAILLEITMHRHWDPNFEGWSRVSPALRIAVYMIFLAGQFFIKQASQKKHYGQYLEKLQQLAIELQ